MRKYLFVLWPAVTLVLSGCSPRRNVDLVLVKGLSKPAPYVEPGDVLKWYQVDGVTPMPVTFASSSGSPCVEQGPTTTCTINKQRGVFNYSCKGCSDPVVPVGKDTMAKWINIADRSDVPDGFIDPVGVACDGSNNAIVDPQVVNRNDRFQWFPTGANPVSAWSFQLAGVCTETDNFDQTKRFCTVKPDATPGTQTYTITVSSCTNTKTYNAQLTIK